MPDWIDSFMADTESLSAPEFRLWTGITILAGAAERRIYTYTYRDILYPNLYTLLCGFPGSGKTLMVSQARYYWAGVRDSKGENLKLGPTNPTRRSFLDAFQKSTRTPASSGMVNGFSIFQAISAPIREFGTFLSKWDREFISDLSDIYDNPDEYTAPRATVEGVNLENPTLNILGAVTPDFIGEIFPDISWGQGITSRLMFIYGASVSSPPKDVLQRRAKKFTPGLKADLNKIFLLDGEFIWTPDAHDALNTWENSGRPPVPTYEKLKYYNERRLPNLIKLSMIAAVSRHQKLTIELEDFERAKKWLFDAETLMPDVFRAMSQKTDAQLLKDLHYHLWTTYSSGVERKKRKPLPSSVIYDWLNHHTTSDKVQRLFDLAFKSGYFKKSDLFQDHWVPRPLEEAGDLL